MRILIVDDDIVSRTKLRLIMENFGECRTEVSGQEAMTAVRSAIQNNTAFDIITLDVSMPGMSGLDALQAIRQLERDFSITQQRQSKILMVTSAADKDLIIACVQSGCNDFIVKPFNLDVIQKKLDKIGISKTDTEESTKTNPIELFDYFVRKIQHAEIYLPPQPRVVKAFHQMVRHGSAFTDIAGLLRKDVAISAELVRASNSAYYRGYTENTTAEQALARLGVETAKELVDSLHDRAKPITKHRDGLELLRKLSIHCLSCAYACDALTQSLGLKIEVDAFTMGMMHDIGKFCLLPMAIDLQKRGKLGIEIHSPEFFAFLDDYHVFLGTRLLERWRFPESLVYVAKYHAAPAQAESASTELLIVHVADSLVQSMGYDVCRRVSTPADPGDAPAAQLLKLDSQKIAAIQDQVTQQMQRSAKILGQPDT
jgi:HD-like signal output (HDOD) protein/CheY-like chemotaxis protein